MSSPPTSSTSFAQEDLSVLSQRLTSIKFRPLKLKPSLVKRSQSANKEKISEEDELSEEEEDLDSEEPTTSPFLHVTLAPVNDAKAKKANYTAPAHLALSNELLLQLFSKYGTLHGVHVPAAEQLLAQKTRHWKEETTNSTQNDSNPSSASSASSASESSSSSSSTAPAPTQQSVIGWPYGYVSFTTISAAKRAFFFLHKHVVNPEASDAHKAHLLLKFAIVKEDKDGSTTQLRESALSEREQRNRLKADKAALLDAQRILTIKRSPSLFWLTDNIQQQPYTLLSGMMLRPNFVNQETRAQMIETLKNVHKAAQGFGLPLHGEDGKFGLPLPLPLPSWSFLPTLDASSREKMRINIYPLAPAQGLEIPSFPSAWGDQIYVLNVLENLPLEIIIKRKKGEDHTNSTPPFTLLLQPGTLIELSQPLLSTVRFSIPTRTRDNIPNSLLATVPTSSSVTANGASRMIKRATSALVFICPNARNDIPEDFSVNAHLFEDEDLPQKEEAKEEQKRKGKSKKMPSSVAATEESKTASLPVPEQLLQSPAELEKQLVHDFYDKVAVHFSHTRHAPWPRVEQFVKELPAGSLVADIGCGNGKYMGLNKDIKIIGCDTSRPLLEICRSKGYEVFLGDTLNIPFPSNRFDAVLSIAVLHHISTVDRRLLALRELVRILKVQGELYLSAWALEQDKTSKRDFEQQDVLVPWKLPKRFDKEEQKNSEASQEKKEQSSGENNSSSEENSEGNGELKEYIRYCHMYSEGELESLFKQLGDIVEISHTFYDRGNWVVRVKKAKPSPALGSP